MRATVRTIIWSILSLWWSLPLCIVVVFCCCRCTLLLPFTQAFNRFSCYHTTPVSFLLTFCTAPSFLLCIWNRPNTLMMMMIIIIIIIIIGIFTFSVCFGCRLVKSFWLTGWCKWLINKGRTAMSSCDPHPSTVSDVSGLSDSSMQVPGGTDEMANAIKHGTIPGWLRDRYACLSCLEACSLSKESQPDGTNVWENWRLSVGNGCCKP